MLVLAIGCFWVQGFVCFFPARNELCLLGFPEVAHQVLVALGYDATLFVQVENLRLDFAPADAFARFQPVQARDKLIPVDLLPVDEHPRRRDGDGV